MARGDEGTVTARLNVRHARPGDVNSIVALVRRTQDHLTALGSLQRLTLPTAADVAGHVAARTALVLEDAASIVGSVFVEPVTPHTMPDLRRWGVEAPGHALWFAHTVVIDPARQGQGWGRILLDGVRQAIAREGPAVLVLDCWAGNEQLRAFYQRAGFQLRGVFPEHEYQVAVFTWCDNA